jgi:hypothetical protein
VYKLAAQLVTRINRYIGTAAEIAAMTLTDIPTGSTFFESDTGILKILNAAGALVEAPSESVQLSGSNVGVEASDTIALSHTADAHDAGDVISTAAGENLEFASLGVAGEHIMITDVTIKYNQNAIPTSHTGYKLHLYNAAPTPIAGDAAHNVIAADLGKYLGYIAISALTDVGDGCISMNDSVNKRVRLVGTGLYGQLQCNAAETPAIDSVFTVILGGMKV